jgi:hypothetical protein
MLDLVPKHGEWRVCSGHCALFEQSPLAVICANSVSRLGCLAGFLIETMEEMKLIDPNPDIDVRALKNSLVGVA